MTILYDRRIEVSVADLIITDLRIAFDLDRQIDQTQDSGTCSIFNLSDVHERRIEERGRNITIVAGYPETAAIVFEGEVQRIIRAREGLAKVTRIKLGDQVRQRNRLSGVFCASYSGPQSVRRVALDIIGLGLGLPVGRLDAIPAGATTDNFYWGAQPAAPALDALLREVECTWYEDDGVIRINRKGMVQPDAPSITTSPTTGLIATPTVTDEGAECRMFLNPAVRLGSLLTIEGSAMDGRWKVAGVRHQADNWSGQFHTMCDLRAIE